MKQSGFGGITGIEIVSLIPEARIPVDDYLLSAGVFLKHSCATFVSRSSIMMLGQSEMLAVAKRMINCLSPAYGICYTRPHSFGPGMYAIGICQGLGPSGWCMPAEMSTEEKLEADRISGWGKAMAAKIWQRGFLRDVYPWNFISEPHLKRLVGTVTFERWVTEDAKRGRLELLREGLWLWEVAEVNLKIVRASLLEADMIFDWKKHL